MVILYPIYNNLYVNLTNKCPCACTFCLRQTRDEMNHSGSLWLEREPSVQEVKDEFLKFQMDTYEEIVFCGFGEPTERLEDLLEIASFVKEKYHKKIRVNTNGMCDLIHRKDTSPMFEGKVDTISISLNTPSKEEFLQLTRCRFGADSFDALLTFAKNVKAYVPDVVLTTVATTISKEEEAQCQSICDSLGVSYRIRPWED